MMFEQNPDECVAMPKRENPVRVGTATTSSASTCHASEDTDPGRQSCFREYATSWPTSGLDEDNTRSPTTQTATIVPQPEQYYITICHVQARRPRDCNFYISGVSRWSILWIGFVLVLAQCRLPCASAFSVVAMRATSRYNFKQACPMSVKDDEEEKNSLFGEDLDTGGVAIEDLSWRVEKLRLEEQNKRRFLKSGARFLPFKECRKWVQAMGRWETEEDWRQWISMGEKRNAYIPSRPDEYYGQLGQWVSWEHFLHTDPDSEEEEPTDRNET